jgi:hypothetical protein
VEISLSQLSRRARTGAPGQEDADFLFGICPGGACGAWRAGAICLREGRRALVCVRVCGEAPISLFGDEAWASG